MEENRFPTVAEVQALQKRTVKFRKHGIITVTEIVKILGSSRPMWYYWANGGYRMPSSKYHILKALVEHLEGANLDELTRIKNGEHDFDFKIATRSY